MEFYIKYGLILMIAIVIFTELLLIKIISVNKNKRKVKIIMAVIFIIFFAVNFILIRIVGYKFPILYTNTILPAICISFSISLLGKWNKKDKI